MYVRKIKEALRIKQEPCENCQKTQRIQNRCGHLSLSEIKDKCVFTVFAEYNDRNEIENCQFQEPINQ